MRGFFLPDDPLRALTHRALPMLQRRRTPLHLDWAVDDVDAALARALAAGAILEQRQEHTWSRLALLADPFGHGFCLLQFSGRGYDEILSP